MLWSKASWKRWNVSWAQLPLMLLTSLYQEGAPLDSVSRIRDGITSLSVLQLTVWL